MPNQNLNICIMPAAGMDDYVYHYANSLAEKNVSVHVIIDQKNLKRFKDFFNSKLNIIVFERFRLRNIFFLRSYKSIYELSKKILSTGSDIFHLQNVGLWELFLIYLLKRKTKIITTIHDPIKHHKSKINIYSVIESLTKLIIKNSDGIILHSEPQKENIYNFAKIDKKYISVQQMGAHDFYKNFEKNIKKEKNILFFGEIRPNKGCDILIDAFLDIKDEIPDWNLVIAGRGYYWETIAKKVEGNEDRIKTMIRYINDNEVADIFNSSEIACTPYIKGTQSGIVSLAGVFGVALISFRFGNMEEILSDNKDVLFTNENTANSLSESIKFLCKNDQKRILLSKNILHTCQTEWSWDSITLNTILFYEKVIKNVK